MNRPAAHIALKKPAEESLIVICAIGTEIHADPRYLTEHGFEIQPEHAVVGMYMPGTRRPVMQLQVSVYSIAHAVESWRWYLDSWLLHGTPPAEAPRFSPEEIGQVRRGVAPCVIASDDDVRYPRTLDGLFAEVEADEKATYAFRYSVLLDTPGTNVDVVRRATRLVLDRPELAPWVTVSRVVDEYPTPAGLGAAQTDYFESTGHREEVFDARTLAEFEVAHTAHTERYSRLLGTLHAELQAARVTTRAMDWGDRDFVETNLANIRSGVMSLPLNKFFPRAPSEDEAVRPPTVDETRAAWDPGALEGRADLARILASLAASADAFPEIPVAAMQAFLAPPPSVVRSKPRGDDKAPPHR